MTDPKENEELSEELSTEELKSVSGGVKIHRKQIGIPSSRIEADADVDFRNPKGSGSGMTTQDWEKWSDGTVSDGERWMT